MVMFIFCGGCRGRPLGGRLAIEVASRRASYFLQVPATDRTQYISRFFKEAPPGKLPCRSTYTSDLVFLGTLEHSQP